MNEDELVVCARSIEEARRRVEEAEQRAREMEDRYDRLTLDVQRLQEERDRMAHTFTIHLTGWDILWVSLGWCSYHFLKGVFRDLWSWRRDRKEEARRKWPII